MPSVTVALRRYVAAAAELEEMQAMEARAEAKAQHMRELDERFEVLQRVRPFLRDEEYEAKRAEILASI